MGRFLTRRTRPAPRRGQDLDRSSLRANHTRVIHPVAYPHGVNSFATPPSAGALEQVPDGSTPRPLAEIMAPDWAEALAPVEPRLRAVGDFLRAESAAGRAYQPAPSDILRAFQRPLADVRVLIVGQDPYPTPGHAMGLSFSVQPHVRPVPRSLQNIYAEMATDLGTPTPVHGDLSAWSDQGVMLLNRVLTVGAGDAGSHRRKGWEAVTEAAIRALVDRGAPLVAILWGRDAATLKPLLGETPVVESAHPSPLSARRGFFGSRPFSRVNELLVAQGATPVDWTLPTA
ncbi:uracil-DNA glycosylase [Oerskovia sp. Sa1BUA8]|uniref:Uracil-DNA glycosylase n=2 Tax=Oerskovia douganii TaxID=2762210 RepID=A0A9D5YXK0_9CELL|nr:uracil-DNA glycosylase [Oerskovia douganii]